MWKGLKLCEDCPQYSLILMPSKENPQPDRGKNTNSRRPGSQVPPKRSDASQIRAKASGVPPESAAFAVVSRRAADRLRAGHLWVYRSDVERVVPAQDGSALVLVRDPRGQPLGTALYSASSQIALRLVGAGALNDQAWTALFRARLRAAIDFRRPMLSEQTDACRLVFGEADFLPGLVVDKYGDLVIFQVLAQGMDDPALRVELRTILVEALSPRAIFEREDARIRELEQIGPAPEGPLYLDPEATDTGAATIFRLNGLRFHYDTGSGQKTGAFLDQRENYAAAARHCRGEALDVCTYQGGFALHLARGCRRVTGVDASRAALEVAERNLDLNRSSLAANEVEWIEANAFDLLREWSDTGAKFDSIVLDPPAFAKSRRAADGALRGYKELNLRALKMLRPGGTLITCSCSHHVGLEEFTAVVAAAASDAHRQVRLLERRGAAGDHPVLLAVPETEYLKCLICRVD
jgi:23S rRNA (cytosine1962-C5)-methyltransferase